MFSEVNDEICLRNDLSNWVYVNEPITTTVTLDTNINIRLESNAYQQIRQSTDNAVGIEMDLLQVGSEPVGMRCPHCQEDVMTKALYRNTTITHIVAIVLGILFWWLCCCIVPYFFRKWKNVEHYCPNCRKFLGVYTRTRVL